MELVSVYDNLSSFSSYLRHCFTREKEKETAKEGKTFRWEQMPNNPLVLNFGREAWKRVFNAFVWTFIIKNEGSAILSLVHIACPTLRCERSIVIDIAFHNRTYMSGSSPSSRIANRKETCECDVDEWIVALLALHFGSMKA